MERAGFIDGSGQSRRGRSVCRILDHLVKPEAASGRSMSAGASRWWNGSEGMVHAIRTGERKGGQIVTVEQKEFWSDTGFRASSAVLSPPKQPRSHPEEYGSPLLEPPAAMHERSAILSRIAEDLGPDLFDSDYLESPVEDDVVTPSEESATEVPSEPADYWNHRVPRADSPYAQQSGTGPQFNMARFLSLTGSLDSGDRNDRWFVLPRRRFRPRPELGIKHSDAPDTLKELRLSSRTFSLVSFIRGFGRLSS